jgi:hypothetical protein
LVVTPAAAADFASLVDIGGGRKMYLACKGAGVTTVALISGKGNGAKSGCNVQAYAPQLVIDAIRDVVESAWAGEATR